MFLSLWISLLAFAAVAADPSLPQAVLADNDSLVTVLLDAGTDLEVTLPDYMGATALMIAAGKDDVPLVERLLGAGADPDAVDRNGDTALNWAVYSGHLGTSRALLRAGADPSIAGHGNALQIALRRGHEELSLELAETMGLRHSMASDAQALEAAVVANDSSRIAAMLQAGVSPDIQDSIGRPLLQIAARLNHLAALDKLLSAGAAVDAEDLNGFTALMVAAREGSSSCVARLLSAGAEVEHRAAAHGLELTPLHLAAIGGDDAVLQVLAGAGANLDVQDVDGAVPMLWALFEGNIDVVLTLMELGADPTLKHKDGDSVESAARKYDIAPVVQALDERGRRKE